MILCFITRAIFIETHEYYETPTISAKLDMSFVEKSINLEMSQSKNISALKHFEFESSLYNLNLSTKVEPSNAVRKLLATDSAWEAGDKICVTALKCFGNFPFALNSSSGLFHQQVFSGAILSIPDPYYDLYSYYPFDLSIGDTSKQNGSVTMKEIDFMFTYISNIPTGTSTVSVIFYHIMSRLYITISFYSMHNFEQLQSELYFFLSGLKHNGSYYTNGTASINQDTQTLNNWNITNICKADMAFKTFVCKMILFPQTIENEIILTIVQNGRSYNETIQIQTLKSGYTYTCSVFENYSTNTFTQSNTFTESKTFTNLNTFPLSNTFSLSNTFTQSNTFTNSNTFSLSNAFTQSNTFTNSNTFTQSNTFTNSNTFLGSNTFMQSNTFTQSNAFTASLLSSASLTNTLMLTYSLSLTQTISICNSTLSISFSVSFTGTGSIYVQTAVIYYAYTAVSYSFYHSYYINVFTVYYPIDAQFVGNDTIIIASACSAIAAVIVVVVIVVVLNKIRNMKQSISKHESDNFEVNSFEMTNTFPGELPNPHIEEDPFAADFKDAFIVQI